MSYYPVPATRPPLKDMPMLQILPGVKTSDKERKDIANWAQDFKPLRQRTVRRETTKAKASTSVLDQDKSPSALDEQEELEVTVETGIMS